MQLNIVKTIIIVSKIKIFKKVINTKLSKCQHICVTAYFLYPIIVYNKFYYIFCNGENA